MPPPPLYAVLDADTCRQRSTTVAAVAQSLSRSGVRLLQYRNKSGSPQEILADAASIREAFSGTGCTLILNDRADLALLAAFDGVHLGQHDLPASDARRLFGPEKLIGLSTHTDAQVRAADLSPASYVAIGPVFSTATKPDAAPVVGLEGVRRARALTQKPLVAIGGITLANAETVLAAGSDSVAVISGLFAGDGTVIAGEWIKTLAAHLEKVAAP